MKAHIHIADMHCSGHGVIHQAAAEQLTVIVINGVLQQGLANSHGYPAMHLTGGQ